jgi:ABC-type glycerol-3-phosphate transport system substrate-binding protein
MVGGIAMGTANNVDHFADIVGLLMAQNGVVFADGKGKVTFQNSITPDGRNLGAEALAFYTLFSTTEKDWDNTMEQSTLAFSEGKVGMILIPSWRLLELVSQNPDLPLKVASVPHLTTDQQTGYASYWVEAVPKTSQHQQEAWEFLNWLAQKDQQLVMVHSQQQVRPFGEPYSRKDLASSVAGDQYLQAYIAQASNLRASIFAGNTGSNDFNDTINGALAKAITQTQSGGTSRDSAAASALNTLAETVTKVLGQ